LRTLLIKAFERLASAGKLQPIIARMRFHGEDAGGAKYSAVATVPRWFGAFDEHRKDASVHGGVLVSHKHHFTGETDEA